jgi:hypothetical protein
MMTMKQLLRVWLLIFVLQILPRGVTSCDDAELIHSDDMHNNDDDDGDNDRSYLRADYRNVRRKNLDVERCGFEDPTPEDMDRDKKLMRKWMKQNGGTALRSKTIQYEIPVYFHVIQPGIIQGLVPDTRIQEHLRYLNVAFARSKAPFVFRLAGITRTIQEQWADNCADRTVELAFKSMLKKGGPETLNVYICNSIPVGKNGALAGYANLPFKNMDSFIRDGVVIARSSSDSRLNTLVHEVGE